MGSTVETDCYDSGCFHIIDIWSVLKEHWIISSDSLGLNLDSDSSFNVNPGVKVK